MLKSNFSNSDIDNILYSAIRNKEHLKTRKKSQLKSFFISLRAYLIEKDKKQHKNINYNILNYLPKSYINLDSSPGNGKTFSNVRDIYPARFSYIEVLLGLSFLINFKPFQKIIFTRIEQKVSKLIELTKLRILICGHPTLSAAFISVYLKKNIDNYRIITVQHGIYNLKKYKVLWFEKEIASHVVVYGEYFKELYEKQGVSNRNLIIGNPYFSTTIENLYKEKKDQIKKINFDNNKVLFLGQQFYKVSGDVSKPYNMAITNLINHFQNLGIDLYYKPHPREDINKSLNKENIAKVTCFEADKSSDAFLNDFDTYYSVNSSLLLETYLKRKICFQIDLPNFNVDAFSKYTGIPLLNESNIENHLDLNEYEFYYDDKYLNLETLPKESLLKIVEQIIKK